MHKSMRGVRRALVVVGAVIGVAVLNAGVASADDPVQLKSRLGDVCLDAPSGSWFTPIVINPCNGTDFQRWNFTPSGQIESVAFPGECLTMPEGVPNRLMNCLDCYSQHWTLQPNGQITTVFSGCLTVLGGPGPGTWVSTRYCNGDAPDQGWDSVP